MSTSKIGEIQDQKEHDIQQKYNVPVDPQDDTTQDKKESDAAKTLQRTYRGYRERRHMQGLSLDPASRWSEVRTGAVVQLLKPKHILTYQ